MDRLVDILLLAPNLFKDAGSVNTPFLISSPVSVEGLSAELSLYKERYLQSLLLAQAANRCMLKRSDDDDEMDDCGGWIGGDFSTAVPESLFYSAKIIVDHVAFRENIKSCDEHLLAEQLIYSSLLFRIAEVAQEESKTQLNVGSCVQLAFCLEVVESFGFSPSCRDQARFHLQKLGWKS